jgi:2-dehydro-3-deoxygluconokinase
VAVALAQWGHESRFVTVLPTHAIGEAALHALRSYGVDTQYILRQGDRLGLYYLEHGAAQRPSKVIYDRTGSSICRVRPGQIDWTRVLNGATWLHVTGITPALSETAAATVFEALKTAKQSGLTASMDLNYRAKLWSKEQARAALTPMMEYVDVAIANEEDAASVFGIGKESFDARSGKIDPEAYRSIAKELVDRFDLDLAAITLRESPSASENTWSACLHDGSEFIRSREYTIRVVDRVGAGDAFAAGLIHSLAAGKSRRDALEFAVAASCLKHTISGDFNLATIEEIESLAAGDTAGRVRR